VFDGDGRYVVRVDGGRRRIRCVSVIADPIDRIEIGTLVRVTPARPWSRSNAPGSTCRAPGGSKVSARHTPVDAIASTPLAYF
jgi:hypothetical protein